MFGSFPQEDFEVVSAEGESRGKVKGIFSSKSIAIPNADAVIMVGDELRRRIQNGTEEVYEVVDPVFYAKHHTIPAHFQVKIRRKGIFEPGRGGNYTIHVAGANSRVNINSSDRSQNIVSDNRLFQDMRTAIAAHVAETEERAMLLSKIDALEAAGSDNAAFLQRYQDLMANAANHMTVLAPFLPMLAQMLG
jgi:hypothetical protein